jgi:hypothetical protein
MENGSGVSLAADFGGSECIISGGIDGNIALDGWWELRREPRRHYDTRKQAGMSPTPVNGE